MQTPPKRRHSSALRDLINYYPINTEKAFKAARVHRTTWNRWLTGQSKIPPATLELIKIMLRGDICDPAFAGFYVTNGVLVDDCGREYTPGDIRACQYYKQMMVQYFAYQQSHDFVPKRRMIDVQPFNTGELPCIEE